MCIKLNEIIQKNFKLLCQVILKLYEIQISMDKISIVSYRFAVIRWYVTNSFSKSKNQKQTKHQIGFLKIRFRHYLWKSVKIWG